MSRKIPIDIIIVDSDENCRKELVAALEKTVINYPLQELYDFNIKHYNQSDQLINYLIQGNCSTTKAIAFIFSCTFINNHLQNEFQHSGQSKNWIKPVIILENRDKLKECKKKLSTGIDIDFILKNNYTLAMCSVLLEQFIGNKS